MRAVRVTEYGGPEVLRVEELADPLPGPGEILVAVAAAGVNFLDVYRRSGIYPGPLPFVPGIEAAGVVTAVGPAPDGAQPRHRIGDRVAWANQPGGYAELAVIPAARAVSVPDALPLAQAASALLQGMTAHYLVHDTYPVGPGSTVLVHAAAGGTGQFLTRLARLRGGRVIGTVSCAEKEKAARAAGAEHVLRHGIDDIAARVRELTDGRGVDAVYDGVGGPTFEGSVASLRPRGTLAVFGQAGGAVPPVDLQRLNTAGSVFVTRPNLDHHIATPAELALRAADVFALVVDGRIDVHTGGSFPLEEAEEAHRALESRASVGKLLLTTGTAARMENHHD
ncbi:quinone oxidoreductase family protein [Streptomyces sp. NPDC087440]|uniref:quinone oxidoreductase family protein n=1 Tax=Streptomyces sp. NPDC087440 TaxID=3365790 RepID=UPI0038098196